ncbi:venom protease [Halyomorpha halys]|uniref:venom protease n=1 Tax=Halyomorpha halys TaxID=286706 RepID=UPI0034D27BC9
MPLRRNVPFYKPPSQPSSEDEDFDISDSLYNYLMKKKNKTLSENKVTVKETTPTTTTTTAKPRIDDTYNAVIKIEETDRKSVKYCKIYTNLTYEFSYASPVLPEIIPFAIVMDNCIPIVKPLVVGGRAVIRGEFPHMAALGYNKTDFIDYLCGGTLISDKHILTAGHCTNTRWGNPEVVMLGSVELYAADSIEAEVVKVINHPDYKASSYYNDIAILELKEEVKFSQYLRPACLPQPETKAHNYGSITIATGWGKTGAAYEASFDLLKVLLRIVNSTECQYHYSSNSKYSPLKDGINENLICAVGYKSKYHDTCQGDSGGPLQTFLPGHKCAFEITGITSFGKMCGTGIPAVYTKVQPYIPWIEDIVWP